MDGLDFFFDVCYGGQDGFVYVATKSKDEFRQMFYRWPEQRHEIKSYVQSSASMYDVYISPSLFWAPSGKKEHVKGSQVVWVEFDGNANVPDSYPFPSLRIQSSFKLHQHIYWRVPFSPANVIENINRKLTYALEADSSGWDANQVLRPPLTHNHKRDMPVVYAQKEMYLRVFGLETFDFLSDLPPPITISDIGSLPLAKDVKHSNHLSKKITDLMQQKDVPVGTRSSYLMYLGYMLAEAGLAHEEIVSLLLEADDRIEKFINRGDRLLRLAEIASIAIQKYGSDSTLPSFSFLDFIDLDIPFVGLWGELLPKGGSLMLAGEPGVGKTQLSLQVAKTLCVASSSLFDLPCPEHPLKILFIEMDMASNGLQRLLRIQFGDLDDEQKKRMGENFIISPIGSHSPRDMLEKLIEEHKPDGVMFDSLSKLSLKPVASEEEAKVILDWEATIRKTIGCFNWFIHHNRKANENNKKPSALSDVYGSFLYGADMDTVLTLLKPISSTGKDKVSSSIQLVKNKVRYGDDGERLLLLRTDKLLFEQVKANNNTGLPTPPALAKAVEEAVIETVNNPFKIGAVSADNEAGTTGVVEDKLEY